MAAFYICLGIAVLILAVAVFLMLRVLKAERNLEQWRARCEERLNALEVKAAQLEVDPDLAPEARAEDRKRAREAERRFTEGVASILSFSCKPGGRGGAEG